MPQRLTQLLWKSVRKRLNFYRLHVLFLFVLKLEGSISSTDFGPYLQHHHTSHLLWNILWFQRTVSCILHRFSLQLHQCYDSLWTCNGKP